MNHMAFKHTRWWVLQILRSWVFLKQVFFLPTKQLPFSIMVKHQWNGCWACSNHTESFDHDCRIETHVDFIPQFQNPNPPFFIWLLKAPFSAPKLLDFGKPPIGNNHFTLKRLLRFRNMAKMWRTIRFTSSWIGQRNTLRVDGLMNAYCKYTLLYLYIPYMILYYCICLVI